jgi:hypothetical protein
MKNLLLLLTVSFILFSCGETKENAAEKIAEEAIEAETGENVDINIEDESGSVTITTKDGDAEFSANNNAEIPDDFPDDVFVYPDTKVQLSMAVEGNFSLKLIAGDGLDEIISKYEKEMTDEGWKIEGSVDIADQKTRIFKKNNRQVSVSVAPENNQHYILINTAILNDM